MRGVGRVSGRGFKPPENRGRAPSPLDLLENVPNVNELDDVPRLEPINDEWTISDPFEPVDPRDCAKYPASPYCEGDLFRIGPPVGFDVDIRISECTTCVYIYPVVGFMRLTPTIICRRDPNCEEDNPPPPPPSLGFNIPPKLNENVLPDKYKSVPCANRESQINRNINYLNDSNEQRLKRLTSGYKPSDFVEIEYRGIYIISETQTERISFFTYSEEQIESGCFDYLFSPYPFIDDQGNAVSGVSVFHKLGDQRTFFYASIFGEKRFLYTNTLTGEFDYASEWEPHSGLVAFRTWEPAQCCGKPKRPPRPQIKPPPPPPPPFGRDDDRKRGGNGKKGGKDCMCCNDCRDSKDNTDVLLKELRAIRKVLGSGKLQKALNAAVGIGDDSITGILETVSKRVGINSYPIEVPESLLQGIGDKTIQIQSNAEYLYWLTKQFDGLVGQFPIEIEVKDIDPLTEGDQKKKISLPNIAEAVAEMYGLTIKNSVNQEVELNMLLRLAAEVIATKNAAVVTQDYARANANFLGYKANYKARELQYNFDFSGANLDPKAKEPVILEKLLKTVTGYVQGWQLEDKETVVGFLQKLVFSAGIIKAVFFRGKGNQKELQREINSMSNDEKSQEQRFEAFIKEINDPNSKFNKGTDDKPVIRDETPPDTKGAK